MILLLPQQTLNIVGIPYGDADASAVAKIHPGNFFIFLSFFVLIVSRGDPIADLFRMARHYTAYFFMLMIYIAILVFWAVRGPGGVGMILDTHIGMPIAALVFSYAPPSMRRRITLWFVAIVAVNSAIGIGESFTHLRLLPFDPSWEVLKQDYFRASALFGHPLSNAVITAVTLFVVIDLPLHPFLKAALIGEMLISLVGFGGRMALVVAVAGCALLGARALWASVTAHGLTVMRLTLALVAALAVPAIAGGALYAALHSDMGARLMAYDSLQDDSARVRVQSWKAPLLLSPEEVFFGVDGDRVDQISQQLDIASPTSDIENPWILMFMFLGAIMFTLWLCGLAAVVRRLTSNASPALTMAVIGYFVIASSSNSFGRKDPMFLLLPGLIICAKMLTDKDNIDAPNSASANLSLTDDRV
ncbi:MAG: VpsF family polysaccharide biosynthesis protein [Alphaproteobacteria bacterium]|nr:VpsF family polysaccharide biosynthesis protein [Alphaproteobacteria bacterium]